MSSEQQDQEQDSPVQGGSRKAGSGEGSGSAMAAMQKKRRQADNGTLDEGAPGDGNNGAQQSE